MATSPSNTVTQDIVGKLWNLCNVLKDDGVTYHQYVTELTYLLPLKMAKETGPEEQIPLRATAGTIWRLFVSCPSRLEEYKRRSSISARTVPSGAGDFRQRQFVHQEADDAFNPRD